MRHASNRFGARLVSFPARGSRPSAARGPVDLLTEITIFTLACFVGFEVISKVPNTLHTPLMAGTNAIHGIVIVGGILAIAVATGDTVGKVLAVIAVAFGTINVVGGFLVTDRMLEMFKGKKPERVEATPEDGR
jgi:NAD(P) transhydrogenase subunit alpha